MSCWFDAKNPLGRHISKLNDSIEWENAYRWCYKIYSSRRTDDGLIVYNSIWHMYDPHLLVVGLWHRSDRKTTNLNEREIRLQTVHTGISVFWDKNDAISFYKRLQLRHDDFQQAHQLSFAILKVKCLMRDLVVSNSVSAIFMKIKLIKDITNSTTNKL